MNKGYIIRRTVCSRTVRVETILHILTWSHQVNMPVRVTFHGYLDSWKALCERVSALGGMSHNMPDLRKEMAGERVNDELTSDRPAKGTATRQLASGSILATVMRVVDRNTQS